MVDNALSPHGGELVQRVLTGDAARQRIQGLPAIPIREPLARECMNIALGFFSPLQGFLTRADLHSVVETMRLANGYIWSVPVVFDVSVHQVAELGLKVGDSAVLTFQNNPLAVLEVEDIYSYDKEAMARHVYGTTEEAHPGVARTYAYQERFIGGPVTLVNQPNLHQPFADFWYTPATMRQAVAERGWKRVVAHQTRNVPHAGHEWSMKGAWFASDSDGVLVSAVVGEKKLGDYIDEAILMGHNAVRQAGYFREDVHMTSMLLWDMRYAGPKEAVFHAIVRKNLGCTHHMFGRDHAGVGRYYDTYAAHHIFSELPPLGIEPVLNLEWWYCPVCKGSAYEGLCGHTDQKEDLSGTLMRRILDGGEEPDPAKFRPEVLHVVRQCATDYGFDSPFVTEQYLANRNPVMSLGPMQ